MVYIGRMFLIIQALTGVVATVLALLLRGGPVLLAVGVQVRTADGSRAGRVRCAARTALAWSTPFLSIPILAIMVVVARLLLAADLRVPLLAVGLVMILTWLVGVGFTVATPERGPHDRVVGTYLVPK